MEIEIIYNVFRSIYQETGYNKFVLLGSLSVIGAKIRSKNKQNSKKYDDIK